MVPEGSVDIQVYLFDLCGEGMSLLLHFLEDKEKDKVMDWKLQKEPSQIFKKWQRLQSSDLIFSFVVLFDFLDVQQQSPGLTSELQRDAFVHTFHQLNTHAKEPQKDSN